MSLKIASYIATAIVVLPITLGCEADRPTATTLGAGAPATASVIPSPSAAARPNQMARGSDARGSSYELSYQPDWVSKISVAHGAGEAAAITRLFTNPGYKMQSAGSVIGTRIASPAQGLDFEIILNDPGQVITRVIVETVTPSGPRKGEITTFTIEDVLPPPPPDDEEPTRKPTGSGA
jgi:hypothetical protein